MTPGESGGTPYALARVGTSATIGAVGAWGWGTAGRLVASPKA